AVQRRIAASAEQLRERVATRKQPITGVSTYPILVDEPTPEQPSNTSGSADELLRSSPTPMDGGTVAGPSPRQGKAPSGTPHPLPDPDGSLVTTLPSLPIVRLAAPFERLRDHSEAWARQRGAGPRIVSRSEERRVGKEGRSGGGRGQSKKETKGC